MKNKLPLRIATFNKPPIIGITRTGGEKNCRFTGILGEAANDLVEYGHFNCSLIVTSEEEGYGHLNRETGKYNGMHGSIQANESDFGLCIEMVPLEVDDFKYGPVLTSSRITVGSMYREFDKSSNKDLSVMDSFGEVSRDVWIFFVLFLTVFWLLLKLGKKSLKRSNYLSSYWTIVTFFLNEETFEVSGYFFRIFSLLLTFLVFYFRFFFASFTKTQLVQPKYPTVIDSFEDILNFKYHPDYGFVDRDSVQGLDSRSKDLVPYFSRQTRSIHYFMYAPQGSTRRSIYEKALKIHGSNEKMRTSFGLEHISQLANNSKPENLLIEMQPILQFIRRLTCQVMQDEKAMNSKSFLAKSLAWFGRNASISYSLGFVYSESVEEMVKEKLDNFLYGFAQSGLIHITVDSLSNTFFGTEGESSASKDALSSLSPCMKDEIHVEVPNDQHLQLKHLAPLFVLASHLLLVACATLLLELLRVIIRQKLARQQRNRTPQVVYICRWPNKIAAFQRSY